MDSVRASGRIEPTRSDDWDPYPAGSVVFLHRTSVPANFILSYVREYFDRGASSVHLVQVDLPLRCAGHIEPDRSCVYDHAVAHRGPIISADDLPIIELAVFKVKP